MPERNSNITFGNYLKSKREEAGLDLESISMETRISKKLLESIENEDHAKLPEPVYVKGFIRAYAKFIGADVDRVIDNYAESRRNYIGTAQPKVEVTTKSVKKISDFRPHFILGTVVIVIIISIVALAVYFYQDRSPSISIEPAKQAEKILHPKDDLSTTIKSLDQTDQTDQEVQPVQPEEINREAMESLTEEDFDEKEVASPEEKTDFLNLSIAANAETWLKIIIDGERPLEYLLKPGDKIALNAKSHYNLLIGNAGGVQLNLNGQPVQIPGRMGQVVNLTLP